MSTIIIRAFSDSIMDTSKQRVIESCCDNKKLVPAVMLSGRPNLIDIVCDSCGKTVIGIR